MTVHPETNALIAYFNSLMAIDRLAVSELFLVRVPCNRGLIEHQTVQVEPPPPRLAGIGLTYHRLGFLGVLNGYCGTVEQGPRRGAGPIAVELAGGRPLRFLRVEQLAQ